MINVRRLNHAVLYARDRDRSRDFYRETEAITEPLDLEGELARHSPGAEQG